MAAQRDAGEEERQDLQAWMRAIAEERFSLERSLETVRQIVEQTYANR